MSKKIVEYEIVDHSVNHEQYFQGCGVAFTKFDECFTGMGRSLYGALDDALEQLAMSGEIDLSLNCTLVDECEEASDNDDVSQTYKDSGELESDDSSLYYYASIRIKRA